MPQHCQRTGCENPIPAQSLAKHKNQRYCSRSCASEAVKAALRTRGFYTQFSVAGNAAQQAYKEQHGEVPGYPQRKAALQRPDRPNNRGKREEAQ